FATSIFMLLFHGAYMLYESSKTNKMRLSVFWDLRFKNEEIKSARTTNFFIMRERFKILNLKLSLVTCPILVVNFVNAYLFDNGVCTVIGICAVSVYKYAFCSVFCVSHGIKNGFIFHITSSR